ncbi:MAG TPA: hypothetical protein VF581_11440 [Flavobacterium sp.]|jgi:hypothetical protein
MNIVSGGMEYDRKRRVQVKRQQRKALIKETQKQLRAGDISLITRVVLYLRSGLLILKSFLTSECYGNLYLSEER